MFPVKCMGKLICVTKLIFSAVFLRMWNLVCHIMVRTQT